MNFKNLKFIHVVNGAEINLLYVMDSMFDCDLVSTECGCFSFYSMFAFCFLANSVLYFSNVWMCGLILYFFV